MDERPACIFLPGIIAPAVVRYAALIRELDANARAHTKELELYALSPPPADYAIADELDGLSRWASRAGLERFHLYGHSGGGAVALAFTAAHPERVLTLTLDEAAFDFSAEMHADLAEHRELQRLMLEDPAQAMPRFMQLELKPGVQFAPPTGGAPPLPNRPGRDRHAPARLRAAHARHRRPARIPAAGALHARLAQRRALRALGEATGRDLPRLPRNRLRRPPSPQHLAPSRAGPPRRRPPRPLGRAAINLRQGETLYVTITSSKGLSREQAERVHGFLDEFLPRLKRQPGVKQILHGASTDGGDVTTVIVWETAEAAKSYRESDLIREPIALETELGIASTRDGFTVTQHLD